MLDSRTISSAKSVSLKTFAGCLLLCRGPNVNPGSVSSSAITSIIYTETIVVAVGPTLRQRLAYGWLTVTVLDGYMPYDGWSEHDKFAEYMEVLSEIQQLIHTYNPAHVIHVQPRSRHTHVQPRSRHTHVQPRSRHIRG